VADEPGMGVERAAVCRLGAFRLVPIVGFTWERDLVWLGVMESMSWDEKRRRRSGKGDWFGFLPTECGWLVGLGRIWSDSWLEFFFGGFGGFIVNEFSQSRAERSPTGRSVGCIMTLSSWFSFSYDEKQNGERAKRTGSGKCELLANSGRIWSDLGWRIGCSANRVFPARL
jgi:hypothetical protein